MYASNSAAQVSTSLKTGVDAERLAAPADLGFAGVPEVGQLAVGEAVLLGLQQQVGIDGCPSRGQAPQVAPPSRRSR